MTPPYRPKRTENGAIHAYLVDADGNPLALGDTIISGTIIGSEVGTQLQTNATANGDGSTLALEDTNYVVVNVRGITTAEVVFEATPDDVNWENVYGMKMDSFLLRKITDTNGTFICAVAGYKTFRARIDNYTSGTINVTTRKAVTTGYQQVFANIISKFSFENTTLGVALMQEKKTINASNVPLPFGASYSANAGVGKPSAGNLFSVMGTNINAAVRYLQLFNKATTPVNTDVPVVGCSFPLAPDNGLVILGEDFFSTLGEYFTIGIAWAFSTTKDTLTLATAGDHAVRGHYF